MITAKEALEKSRQTLLEKANEIEIAAFLQVIEQEINKAISNGLLSCYVKYPRFKSETWIGEQAICQHLSSRGFYCDLGEQIHIAWHNPF